MFNTTAMIPYRIGFVIEQALGHKTHGQNLRAMIDRENSIETRWVLPEWQTEGFGSKLPVYNSNWTVQAGWQARRGLTQLKSEFHFDGLFFHTQVPAVLASDWVAKYPSVISLDATPIQYDSLGDAYAHARGSVWFENLKYRLNKRCFHASDHLVTWSQWAKDGLIEEYDVPSEKITVISPGVNVKIWSKFDKASDKNGSIKILFVGGNLKRKGGKTLLDAFHFLRSRTKNPEKLELHLVTQDRVAEEPGVYLHLNLEPNSSELISLFHQSDIFCLPTQGDCLPMALAEAGAAGLPIISTKVGGVEEIVHQGENGFLIEPNDTSALIESMDKLIDDDQLRHYMGAKSHQIVGEDHNAEINANRLVEIICNVIDASRQNKKYK